MSALFVAGENPLAMEIIRQAKGLFGRLNLRFFIQGKELVAQAVDAKGLAYHAVFQRNGVLLKMYSNGEETTAMMGETTIENLLPDIVRRDPGIY